MTPFSEEFLYTSYNKTKTYNFLVHRNIYTHILRIFVYIYY